MVEYFFDTPRVEIKRQARTIDLGDLFCIRDAMPEYTKKYGMWVVLGWDYDGNGYLRIKATNFIFRESFFPEIEDFEIISRGTV